MAKKTKTGGYPLGDYLKMLREKRGASLKDVEKDTGIPNAYISQLETGARKKLPEPDRMRVLADYYNITVQELLAKAGYIDEGVIEETLEQQTDKAFRNAISDPLFRCGGRINPTSISIDAKRFVIEIYEKNVKGRIWPNSFASYYDEDIQRTLRWKVKDVKRERFVENKPLNEFVKYTVTVECWEFGPDPEGEVPTEVVQGQAEIKRHMREGHEWLLLEEATNLALKDGLSKFKRVNWMPIVFGKESKR